MIIIVVNILVRQLPFVSCPRSPVMERFIESEKLDIRCFIYSSLFSRSCSFLLSMIYTQSPNVRCHALNNNSSLPNVTTFFTSYQSCSAVITTVRLISYYPPFFTEKAALLGGPSLLLNISADHRFASLDEAFHIFGIQCALAHQCQIVKLVQDQVGLIIIVFQYMFNRRIVQVD